MIKKKTYQKGGFLNQLSAAGQTLGTLPVDYLLNSANYFANILADNKLNSENEAYQDYWRRQYQIPSNVTNPIPYGNPYAMQLGGMLPPDQRVKFKGPGMKFKGIFENLMNMYNPIMGMTNNMSPEDWERSGFSNTQNSMKKGGIHIKPENRGKFTEYCGGKVTAECIERGKNSSSAAVRKRATFAANARKWHQEGGEICLECIQDNFNPLAIPYTDFRIGGPVPFGYKIAPDGMTLLKVQVGGVIPQPTGIAPEDFERDRIQQIIRLSTQYGVPTNQIYSKGQRDLVTNAPDADIRYYDFEFINPSTNQWQTVRHHMDNKRKGYSAGVLAKRQTGGVIANSQTQQQGGYFMYPNASSITFPGQGLRTFVPGPFPLGVQDQYGTQALTNRPINTYGPVVEYPLFKEGGEVKYTVKEADDENATIEAERGEYILGIGAAKDPTIEDDSNVGVGLYKVPGKKHYQGGTKLSANPGDFIFSDDKSLAFSKDMAKDMVGRTINKLRNRTPAKLVGTYNNLNDFIKLGQDSKATPIDRKTAILNTENIIDKLADIAIGQEALKGFPSGIPVFAQASLTKRFTPSDNTLGEGDLPTAKYGGQYQTGGNVGWPMRGYSTNNFEYVAPGEMFTVNGQPPITANRPTVLNTNLNDDGRGYGRFMEFQLPNTRPPVPTNQNIYWWNMVQPTSQPTGGVAKPNYWLPNGIDNALPQDFGSTPPTVTTQEVTNTAAGSSTQVAANPFKPLNLPTNYFALENPSTIVGPSYQAPVQETIKENATYRDPNPSATRNYNTPVNMNIAELYGLMAANRRYDSRYPTAQRFYEGDNIDALIASSYRPLSAVPYISNIQRQLNTFNANNSGYGPVSYARNAYAFTQALNASNQAIGQVEQQNIARQDQQAQSLAQNQAVKGQYRLQLQDKYLRELETVKNNQENAAKARAAQTSNILNAYTNRAYSQKYANAMMDNFQIDANGNLVPIPGRSLRDAVMNSTTGNQMQSQLSYMEQLFRLMNRYGIRSSAFVDDFVKPITGGK